MIARQVAPQQLQKRFEEEVARAVATEQEQVKAGLVQIKEEYKESWLQGCDRDHGREYIAARAQELTQRRLRELEGGKFNHGADKPIYSQPQTASSIPESPRTARSSSSRSCGSTASAASASQRQEGRVLVAQAARAALQRGGPSEANPRPGLSVPNRPAQPA